MKGFRDTMQLGPHTVRLDGVDLSFDAEGVLWEPSPDQADVLTKDANRIGRFEEIEPMGKSPLADEPVTGPQLFETPMSIEGETAPPCERQTRRKGQGA